MENEDLDTSPIAVSEPTPRALLKFGSPHCASCGGSWQMSDLGLYLTCTNFACPTHGKKYAHPFFDLVEIPD